MLTLPYPVPLHDIVAIAHHVVADPLAITLNCILISAIIIASPPSLKSYKLILLCSTLVDLSAGITQLAVISRVVPAPPTLAQFYVGPCTLVSGGLCYMLEKILYATVNQTLFLIIVSFCYRIYILRREQPSTIITLAICAASFIPNGIWLLVFSTAQDETALVVAALRISRPTYSVDSYVVEGFLDMFSSKVIVFITTMCVPMYPEFILIFLLRRKFIKSISGMSDTMSERTRTMHLALCKVLFLQSSLPMCYFPSVIFFFQCVLYESMCSTFQEHGMLEVASYFALIAPLISLFYIKPYRKFALTLLPCTINRETTHSKSSTKISQSTHTI